MTSSNPPAPPDPRLPDAFGGPGGSAVFTGSNFQAAIATYIAAVALAEQPQQLGEAFPAGVPTRLGAEQHWPIDDLAVSFGTSFVWLQAKRELDRGDLRVTFAQFVAQAAYGRGRGDTPEPLGSDDRFVVAYERAPGWAEDAIPVLDRIRHGATLIDEITQGSKPAKDAYDILVEAIKAADASLDTGAVHAVLQRVHFFAMTSTGLDITTRSALHFVVKREAISQSLAVLYRLLDQVAGRRSLRDVAALRAALREAGSALLAPPSVRADIDVLLVETARNLDVAALVSSIPTANGEIHLDRAITAAVVTALNAGNVIVTAPAGEDKSVVLRDAALQLRTTGKPVVLLNADGEEPRLVYTLAQIFERWDEPGYLLIDGFDSLRLGPAANRLRTLIARLRDTAWRVAIASREYDLANDAALRRLFPSAQTIDAAYRVDDDRFRNVAVMRVNALAADEIAELRRRSTTLDRLFATAPPSLAGLLTNPFNLSIAGSLSADVNLAGVRDRGELLSIWWGHRVAIDGSANEAALRTMLRGMIARRRLELPTGDLDAHTTARDTLLSNGVLVHRGQANTTIAFRHTAIFDFAVERLLLSGDGAPAALLGDDPDAFVFILPSVRSHFEALYARAPAAYLAEMEPLFAEGHGRAALSLALAQIPAFQLRAAADLVPLLDGDPAHAKIFHHIVSSALYWSERGMPLGGPEARPWADVALLAAQQVPAYGHDSALLVDEASKRSTTTEQGRVLAHAARLLVIDHLTVATDDPRVAWFAPIALPGFIRTIDSEPVPALPLLRRLVAPDRIALVGQYELFPLATSVGELHDPGALELLFRGIFADVTLPSGTLSIGRPNVALNLVQDSSQILGVVRGMLARRFAGFLENAPREAIRSLCVVVGMPRPNRRTRPVAIALAGVQHDLLADNSQSWEDMPYHDHDDWKVVTQALEVRLRTDLDVGQTELFAIALETIAGHGPDLLLWRILLRNAGRTAESARAMLPLVTQRIALVQPELQEPFVDYLGTGYARLEPDERATLDEAILSVAQDETNVRLREHRADLVATYADAIPDGLSPTLEAYRHATPPTQHERELTLRGITEGFPGDFRLPNATVAPSAPPPELSAPLAAADPFLTGGGETDVLTPTLRWLHDAIASVDAPPTESLTAFVRLVREGMVRKVLTDEELRQYTPLLLTAASFDPAADEDDD